MVTALDRAHASVSPAHESSPPPSSAARSSTDKRKYVVDPEKGTEEKKRLSKTTIIDNNDGIKWDRSEKKSFNILTDIRSVWQMRVCANKKTAVTKTTVCGVRLPRRKRWRRRRCERETRSRPDYYNRCVAAAAAASYVFYATSDYRRRWTVRACAARKTTAKRIRGEDDRTAVETTRQDIRVCEWHGDGQNA